MSWEIIRSDRNGRTIEYDFDNLFRLVEERWLDASNATINVMRIEYDEASQMLATEDLTIGSRYDYAFDNLGRVTQIDVNNGGPSYHLQTPTTYKAARPNKM